MKIPWIPVHILTERQLQKERLKTEQSTRALTNKQMGIVLHDNAKLRQTITEIRRKWKKLNLN